jgi:hypothetical protein
MCAVSATEPDPEDAELSAALKRTKARTTKGNKNNPQALFASLDSMQTSISSDCDL